MAPKSSKSATVEEASVQCSRRAAELNRLKAVREVKEIIKKNPSVCEEILKILDALGLRELPEDPTANQSVASGRTEWLQGREKKRHEKLAKQQEQLCGDEVPPNTPDKDLVPAKAMVLQDLTVPQLQKYILEPCEPGSLSTSNFRSKGVAVEQGVDPKLALLRLVTLIAGVEGDLPLRGKLRIWSELTNFVKICSENRGRMGRDIVLPVCFQRHGIFHHEVSENGIVVWHRGIGRNTLLKVCDTPPGNTAVLVDYNWSERRAVARIALQHQVKRFMLCDVFATHLRAREAKLKDLPGMPRSVLALALSDCIDAAVGTGHQSHTARASVRREAPGADAGQGTGHENQPPTSTKKARIEVAASGAGGECLLALTDSAGAAHDGVEAPVAAAVAMVAPEVAPVVPAETAQGAQMFGNAAHVTPSHKGDEDVIADSDDVTEEHGAGSEAQVPEHTATDKVGVYDDTAVF